MTTIDLEGIIPAVVLPMTEDYQPDISAYKNYLDWLIPQGPVGLAISADTGEGPHLTAEEKSRVLEAAVEVAGGRCRIIAGISGPSTAAAEQQAREAKAIGADGLLVFPVSAFLGEPLMPEVPYAYHRAIAEAADLPIILFQLQPDLGGVHLSREVLLRLIEIPQVVALKEASFDAMRFLQTKSILEQAPRKITLLTGNDNFILESFVLGAEGALTGFGTILCDLQVRMFEAWKSGSVREARSLGKVIQALADVTFAPPVRDYRCRLKEAFVMMGVIPRATVRPPLLPLREGDRKRLHEALIQADVLEAYSDPG